MEPIELKKALISLFRYNNQRWNVVRDVIKKVEKSNMYAGLSGYYGEALKNYLTCVRYEVEDSLIDSGKLRKVD
jgi:hypothetical protein